VKVLSGGDEVLAAVGSELGVGRYVTLSQQDVDTFADVTGDHQWIHVDVERARQSPFGSTIAHGFLTLSLLPALLADVYQFSGFAYGVNYGLNRVRFPAPVPVGSRVRARATLAHAEPIAGGLQVIVDNIVEREGGTKPVCVAELVVRLYTDTSVN
jgi:acyl dehydratase